MRILSGVLWDIILRPVGEGPPAPGAAPAGGTLKEVPVVLLLRGGEETAMLPRFSSPS